MVTTESQRAGWQLPDLCSSGRARVVDESEAFGLLRAPADAPPPTRWDGGPDGPVSEALRALGAPDTRLEQVLEALGRVDLPGGVCENVASRAPAGARGADGREGGGPGAARVAPAVVSAVSGALGRGGGVAGAGARARRSRSGQVAAGRGAGGQDAERLLHGVEDGVAGRIVEGLCETGVNNLVFILEEIDRVDDEGAGVLLDVLDPQRRRAFRDAYLDVPFDLCDVLWIATATDPGRIPAPVRKWLAVIELAGYSVEEDRPSRRR